MSPLKALGAGITVALAMATGLAAQNLFAPVITVNEDAITGYELAQRARFIQVLNRPGDPNELARRALIDDRLRLQAARTVGLEVLPEGIEAGMEEFASRANLSKDQFVAALARAGVAEQTFRDFVAAGVTWRELIRGRFGPRVRITDAEIDRALQSTSGASNVRVLISEIIMPAPPPQLAAVRARAERISRIRSTEAFSAEARRFSATPTRARGGRLDWVAITKLPPQLRSQILALAPGEVTAPLPLPNAIALFQLRAIEETDRTEPDYSEIEYAAYYIPGGRTEAGLTAAAQLRSRVGNCNDLYGIAKGQPKEILDRGALPPGEIPRDIAIELAKLDEGEVSTTLTRADGQTLVFLMLCKRTAKANEDASRETVAATLRQRRLNAYAESYLDQLRADARIVER